MLGQKNIRFSETFDGYDGGNSSARCTTSRTAKRTRFNVCIYLYLYI